MSGTALAAGVPANQGYRSLAIAVCIVGMMFTSGCGVSNATPSVGQTDAVPATLEIDAGVILTDRASYLCVPLSRFGLSSSQYIESISSSCECVKPSLVRYADSSTTSAEGVLLEFVADEPSADPTPLPTALGVIVTCSMTGGETQAVTVSLLHTRLSIVH